MRRHLATLGVLAFLAPVVSADVPEMMQFQGLLLDSGGQPVNGPTDFVFTLYAQENALSPFWSETHSNVDVIDGVYSVELGETTPIAASALSGGAWIQITVEGETLTPRKQFLSVSYAMHAKTAESALSAPPELLPDVPKIHQTSAVETAGDVGAGTSITIGQDGLPAIAFVDVAGPNIDLIKCGDASCSTANVRNPIEGGTAPSIAIGADGFPVISYANGGLKVAHCTTHDCSTNSKVLIDPGVTVGATSITIGFDGFPVVAYSADADVRVVKCASSDCGSFAAPTVIRADAKDPSIAMGIDGRPWVAYQTASSLTLEVTKCQDDACTTDAVWLTDVLGNAGFAPSLTIADDGGPIAASYREASGNFTLTVSSCETNSCLGPSITNVPIDFVGMIGTGYTSITIGNGGLPVIAYQSGAASAGRLSTVKCSTRDCSTSSARAEIDDAGMAGDLGQYISAATPPDGLPLVSYYDAQNGDLKITKCGNRLCLPFFTRR